MNLRRAAALLATVGLVVGLIGAGVSASYSDNATAAENINVGTFACTLTTTTPGAIVSDNGHTVTFTEPEIQVSDPPQGGNDNGGLTVTLRNTGSMTEKVHWTIVGPDYNIAPYNAPPWNAPLHHMINGLGPFGTFGTSAGSPSMTTDVDPFAPGASLTYTSLGFMWLTPLDNLDLGVTVSATYHVDCTEHVVAASHISFVGYANALGHAALPFPSGTAAGDLAVVMTYGTSTINPGCPTGYPTKTNTVQDRTYLCSKILVAGDLAGGVPATTAGSGKEVAVYRGASGLGAATYSNTSNGLPPESPNYPLYCTALSLTKIDGSSWVGCMTHDTGNTTGDIRLETFSKVISLLGGPPSYTPPVLDGSITTNRSAGATDNHSGLADTNGGVASWTNGGIPMGGWVMPLSTTNHQTETYGFELLSQ